MCAYKEVKRRKVGIYFEQEYFQGFVTLLHVLEHLSLYLSHC
jgi:hypothetical protein